MQQLAKKISHLIKRSGFALAIILACSTSAYSQPATLASSPADYKLGTGDKIQIDVYDEVDLGMTTTISQSGNIAYPFLGDLKILGLTPKEVEQLITTGLKGTYLADPQVSVTIVEYRPFYITGEVKQSGAYAYQPGLTVRRAISLAGGFTDRASKTKVTIIREEGSKSTSTSAALDDLVNPGDTVSVE